MLWHAFIAAAATIAGAAILNLEGRCDTIDDDCRRSVVHLHPLRAREAKED
jgi:hypothetical protein